MQHGGDIYANTIEYDFSVNLNPLDCSEVIKSIIDASASGIGNYPDLLQRDFRKAVAELEGIRADEVMGGNGASELLMAIIQMLRPSKALLLRPCFFGYYHILRAIGECEIVEHGLMEENDFLLDETFLDRLRLEADKGLEMVILTNPNNPNGRNIPKDILRQTLEICKRHEIKLLIDECFIRMSGAGYSMVQYINDYKGLFVVNAFTKLFSIPGVRVGYVVSCSDNIGRLSYFLPEWNMSVIAQKAGEVCSSYLLDRNWEEITRATIAEEKKYLCEGLKELGFKVYGSDAGFVLFFSKEEVYEYLKAKKILIRDMSEAAGLCKGYYRVAVKNHKENEILLKALGTMMQQ